MANTNSMMRFFNKIDQTYLNAVYSIKKLLEHGEHIQTSYTEIDFVLRILVELRHTFKQDSELTSAVLEELLKGGHLKFYDDGLFYNELIQHFNSSIQKRSSSHNSCVQQYSLSGPVVKEVLFGISIDKNGNESTWIQFEKHNMNTIIEYILHLFDYLMHKLTGKNIGPYGSSDHTESNPIVISSIEPK